MPVTNMPVPFEPFVYSRTAYTKILCNVNNGYVFLDAEFCKLYTDQAWVGMLNILNEQTGVTSCHYQSSHSDRIFDRSFFSAVGSSFLLLRLTGSSICSAGAGSAAGSSCLGAASFFTPSASATVIVMAR